MAPRPSLQDCFGTLGSSPCRSDLLFCIVQGLSVPHCLVLTEIVAFFPSVQENKQGLDFVEGGVGPFASCWGWSHT